MATILVVDDAAETRLLVRTILIHAGHTVIEADDGPQALARVAELSPDLVLLDLSLPSMNGADVVRALRKDRRTRSMAVALYTATPMNTALRDFMEMYEIRQLIPKPSEPLHFLAAIERALR
jgi:CheY-like chemotaxis protein